MRLVPASIVILSLAAAGAGASARELAGRFGYLGEWDVSASLAEEKAGRAGAPAFSGPVLMKHNAVCGPGETPEKTGHIRISLRGQRYTAQMTLAGASCAFTGTLSESAHSFVTCGSDRQIPLRLWFRDTRP